MSADGGVGESFIHDVTLEICVESVDSGGNYVLLAAVPSQGCEKRGGRDGIGLQLSDTVRYDDISGSEYWNNTIDGDKNELKSTTSFIIICRLTQ